MIGSALGPLLFRATSGGVIASCLSFIEKSIPASAWEDVVYGGAVRRTSALIKPLGVHRASALELKVSGAGLPAYSKLVRI